MTFSIVAVDREKKETGFAIASCCWDAGQVCAARATVGAIASQAQGNLAFLSQFFERLGEGEAPDGILDGFQSADPDIEKRQIGMITGAGMGLSFTGAQCASWAGHRVGRDFACQGNILVGQEVIDSMAEVFESTAGRLHERLLAALVAGDEAGGDRRGKQSARLLVAREGAGRLASNTFLDIRIEDHDEPVREIARILGVAGALMTILGLLGEASEVEGEAKEAALDRLRSYLDDKRQPRYLDWWESLASAYEEAGHIEKSVEAYRPWPSTRAWRPFFERAPNEAISPWGSLRGSSPRLLDRVVEPGRLVP